MNQMIRLVRRPSFERYLSNTSWLFASQIVRLAAGLIVSIAVARHLGPEQFGLYNYILSIVTMLLVLAQLGLHSLARRELVQHPDKKDDILGTCFTLNAVAGLVLYAVMLIAVYMASQHHNENQLGLFSLLGVSLVLLPFQNIELWFNAQVKAKLSALPSMLTVLIFGVFKLLAVYCGMGLFTFACLFFVEMVCLSTLKICFYHKNYGPILRWRTSWSTAVGLLRESWAVILNGVAVTVYMKSDQVMLGAMLSERSVGEYAAAAKISSIWTFIPAVLASSIYPALVNARKVSDALYTKRLRYYIDLNVVLGLLISVGVASSAPILVDLAFGEAYQNAGKILAVHSSSNLFLFLGVARSQYLLTEKFLKFAFVSTLIGAGLNLLMNFVLIPKYGGLGAAWATLAAQFVAAFLTTFFLKNTHGLQWMMLKSVLFPLRLYEIYNERNNKKVS